MPRRNSWETGDDFLWTGVQIAANLLAAERARSVGFASGRQERLGVASIRSAADGAGPCLEGVGACLV